MISFERVAPELNATIIKNILNSSYNYNFDLYAGNTNPKPDLLSSYDDKDFTVRICKIINYFITDDELIRLYLKQCEALIKEFEPNEFVLVVERKVSTSTIIRINEFFEKFKLRGFHLFDLPELDRIVSGNPGLKHLFKGFDDSTNETISDYQLNSDETRSYFLAGAHWHEAGDQSSRFYENGIWENGYDDRYQELVKSAQPNDIIFLKSTYATQTTGYLRIKAIGVVIYNENNGKQLRVDWKIKNLKINIS